MSQSNYDKKGNVKKKTKQEICSWLGVSISNYILCLRPWPWVIGHNAKIKSSTPTLSLPFNHVRIER